MGPCVDTEGHLGFDVTVTLGLGVDGVMGTARAGGGMSGAPIVGSFLGGVGFEGATVPDHSPLVLQGNVGYAARLLYGRPRQDLHGFSLGFGGAWAFQLDRRSPFGKRIVHVDALGLLPRAEVLWSPEGAIGYFSFPITLQRMNL